jgi:hypothetical protein
MYKMLALGLALGSLAAFINGAQAAIQCGPRDKIAEALGQRFQENRQALGIAGQSAVVELFVSLQGSWTMTTTNTKGLTCVIATGEAWQSAPKQLAGLSS